MKLSFYHVASCDYMIKGTCKLVSGGRAPYVTTLPSGNGNITYLFCHVTSRDQMIKGRWDLLSWSPSTCVASEPSFILIGLIEVGMTFLFCKVTSHDHTPQRNMCFSKWEPLNQSHHCAKFNSYKSCRSADIVFYFVT